jgi:hypothetical protein
MMPAPRLARAGAYFLVLLPHRKKAVSFYAAAILWESARNAAPVPQFQF